MERRQLYVIGGATAAGKTTTARELARRLGAPWFKGDTIWRALMAALPEDDANRRLISLQGVDVLLHTPPDRLVEQHIAAARFLGPALAASVHDELREAPAVVADGAWFTPEWVAGLDFAAHGLEGVEVRAVFIHEPVAREVTLAMKHRRGVTATLDWQANSSKAWAMHGDWLATEAGRFGYPVVEARPRDTLTDRVATALGL